MLFDKNMCYTNCNTIGIIELHIKEGAKMEYIKAIDKLGRITLPISLRRKIMLSENDNVIVILDGDSIIIKGARAKCKLCGKSCAEHRNKVICENCIQEIKNL